MMGFIVTTITFVTVQNFFMEALLVLFQRGLSIKRIRAHKTLECFKVKMEKVSRFYPTPWTVIAFKKIIIVQSMM